MPLHYVHRFGFLTHFVLKARYVKRRATNEAPYLTYTIRYLARCILIAELFFYLQRLDQTLDIYIYTLPVNVIKVY